MVREFQNNFIVDDYLDHDHTVSDNGHVRYASKTIGMKLNIIVIKDFTSIDIIIGIINDVITADELADNDLMTLDRFNHDNTLHPDLFYRSVPISKPS